MIKLFEVTLAKEMPKRRLQMEILGRKGYRFFINFIDQSH